jgi:hypothetical protein
VAKGINSSLSTSHIKHVAIHKGLLLTESKLVFVFVFFCFFFLLIEWLIVYGFMSRSKSFRPKAGTNKQVEDATGVSLISHPPPKKKNWELCCRFNELGQMLSVILNHSWQTMQSDHGLLHWPYQDIGFTVGVTNWDIYFS